MQTVVFQERQNTKTFPIIDLPMNHSFAESHTPCFSIQFIFLSTIRSCSCQDLYFKNSSKYCFVPSWNEKSPKISYNIGPRQSFDTRCTWQWTEQPLTVMKNNGQIKVCKRKSLNLRMFGNVYVPLHSPFL